MFLTIQLYTNINIQQMGNSQFMFGTQQEATE